jgi:hypothetical protein
MGMTILIGVDTGKYVGVASDSLRRARHLELEVVKVHEIQMLRPGMSGGAGEQSEAWIDAVAGFSSSGRINDEFARLDKGERQFDEPYDVGAKARQLCLEFLNPESGSGHKRWPLGGVIASPYGLWGVTSGCSVARIPVGEIWAVGSGAKYAMGAWGVEEGGRAGLLHAIPPAALADILRSCARVACRFEGGCGGEIHTRVFKKAD